MRESQHRYIKYRRRKARPTADAFSRKIKDYMAWIAGQLPLWRRGGDIGSIKVFGFWGEFCMRHYLCRLRRGASTISPIGLALGMAALPLSRPKVNLVLFARAFLPMGNGAVEILRALFRRPSGLCYSWIRFDYPSLWAWRHKRGPWSDQITCCGET